VTIGAEAEEVVERGGTFREGIGIGAANITGSGRRILRRGLGGRIYRNLGRTA